MAEGVCHQDQTALTIAKLFVQEIIFLSWCSMLILLSDHGPAFLSYLMTEICELLGVNKINTIVYHPHTNGLTEQFNRTLTDMLAKKVEQSGKDWDSHLHLFFLPTEQVCKSQSKNHHFTCFMDRILDYQQH